MFDSFKVTKLCDHESVSSHLITIGSFNILCDLPLNPKEILNFKKSTIRCNNVDEDKSEENKYIRITNLETEALSNKLLLDISRVPIKIHIILISCSECFMGLPIFCKYFDISDTHIVCTKFTFTFGLSAVENLQTKENYLPPWNEEDDQKGHLSKEHSTNDHFSSDHFNRDEYLDLKLSFRNSLHLLSYKEKIKFQQNDEIVCITPYSSGHSVGSCNFLINTNLLNLCIINKSCYNVKRYPSPLDLACLEKADFVLFTAYSRGNTGAEEPSERRNAPTEGDPKGESPSRSLASERTKERINMCIEKNYKDSLNKICSIVLRTIKSKGCVLIPVDLHFLYFLELIELIGVVISKYLAKEEQVLIFTIIGNISNVIHQADLCAEWVEESRKKKCSKVSNPQGPFSIDIMIKNNRLITGNDINDVTKLFRYPCVCFVQDSSLRFFESSTLLEKWAMEENNSLLLIDPYYDPVSVLDPFHIYLKKINVFFCPISWDLNESDIWEIINNNPNKKCVYLLPHRLEGGRSSLKMSSQVDSTHVGEKSSYNVGEKIGEEENYNKRRKNSPYGNYANGNPHGDVNPNDIIYIYPLLTREIIYDTFSHVGKNLHPVPFTVDGTNNLKKILTKIDNLHCAKVRCSYNSTTFGDYIKEGQMEICKSASQSREVDNKKTDNKWLRGKGVNLMFGSIREEDFLHNLLQLGYSKDDLVVNHPERSTPDVQTEKYLWSITINSINSKVICYTKYDIEVISSHAKLRQQVKDILQKSTTTL
ncbi:conserved Plasmodium protein, unknown function [Plasmodium knowlesi strain H]|uniref:Metallo-beta-lactamase domain-containing protein n=3 Tax=Plasmodium knowlesi TaxID=5850 RepID=A0A5K1U671_PLAKH|nr:ribonuclease, putative [Plasmodium knowlesi strain H]OTN65752.1 Uncharacterized protein PKNOH_S100036900 [Plasmodium knowlesi]CAA9987732.1 ribonuclease, putative [Plasmodium knowlesi strain H]SBO27053.1 conserved Plasmodium protein, unknown function [Plasmodium knowlesi strain H]SBO29464.1 conserved Plasmodium protein, unknown function [Plasmodium knowlesi strain H]VVS77206.1 ribonuclease, putative [Plasmodium knowlesi strain H]|eukprot:XP_002258729.1 hypothetical protein, conserved in Plasmodium species [Plasmodium knowlesi strain H]